MTDKSLPKPVPPADSFLQFSKGKIPVPPSARVPAGSGQPQSVGQPPSGQLTTPSSASPAPPSPFTSGPPKPIGSPPTPLGAKPSGQPPIVPPQPPGDQLPPTPPQTQKQQLDSQSTLTESSNTTQNSDKNKNQLTFAKVKGSPFKFLPYLLGGLVLIGGIVFALAKVMGGNKTQPVEPVDTEQSARKTVPNKNVTLTYWSLWEPENVLTEVFASFEEKNPGVKVEYMKQSHKDYRERLQTALASGSGPDVFRFHAAWTPMLAVELAPMPQSVMTASEYQQAFYPAAAQMLSLNGQVVGIPLMYEGLGLYYNVEMLKAANAEPPSTWAEVKSLASSLTVRSGGEIERGGLAIGNASNVEHFADILALLMLQNGADLTQPDSQEGQDALQFYTNFIKQDKVWSDKLPSSTVAFARADVAMMFAPSWRAHEVQKLNPDLKFGIVPVPRLGDQRIAWASFWAEGVSSKSGNKDEAWQLLRFLSATENQRLLYSAQSQVRAFGEIYSRPSLANELAGDPLVSSFLQDAPSAQGWYLASYTHDNGLNDLLIKYYQDAINAVVNEGKQVQAVMKIVQQGTTQALRQYGVE